MIYQEIPTGTIDGVNTTFTTAETIYEALYVISDGTITDAFTAVGTTLTITTAPSVSLVITYDNVPTPQPLGTGASLGEIKQAVTRSLGTAESRLYTEEKREWAINTAITNILQQYPVPQYIRNYTEMNFTTGVCPLPTDCLLPIKLQDTTENTEYFLLTEGDFDANRSTTYSIKYDETTGTEIAMIYPNDTVTLALRYVSDPVPLEEDGDKVRFRSHWVKAIAEFAAYWLLFDSRTGIADAKYAMARDQISKAWQVETQRHSSPVYNKIESAFSKKSILS